MFFKCCSLKSKKFDKNICFRIFKKNSPLFGSLARYNPLICNVELHIASCVVEHFVRSF